MKVHVFFVLLLLGCHRAENKNNNNNNNNDSASNDSDNVVSNLHASNGEAEEDHLDELIGTYLDSFDQRNKKRECLEVEARVQKFLNETEEIYERVEARLVLTMFEIAINSTEEKAEELKNENMIYSDFQLNLSKNAYDILQEDRETLEKCDKKLLRVLKNIYMERIIPLKKEDRIKDSELNKEISLKLSKLSVVKDGKELTLVADIDPFVATSRDYNELQWFWEEWFNGASKSLKDIYEESVALLDASIKERGFSSIAEVWQLQDFEENIEEEMDRVMNEIMPLYEQLHAYVRNKLFDFYSQKDIGDEHKAYFADKTNPIPIHILGDIYGQTWENLKDLVTPYPENKLDVDERLKRQNYTVSNLTKLSEDFFLSLGFEPMNDIFWKESVFERPANVTMQCHPTAWTVKNPTDFRISMCAEPNLYYLGVIHHEMGHVVYYMEYRHLPFYYRTGANGAFHEAIGDTIALSVESEKHLMKLGFLSESDEDDKHKRDINKLMKDALKVIAFFPFSYTLETWRYNYFKGQYDKDNANTHWWKLSLKNQGIVPPSNRSDPSLLDPTGKFHIPTHTPYARYFFSHLAMYQFHEVLCKLASHKGPIHTCDIHGSEEAGEKFREMLEKGSSKSWREVMKVFTGTSGFSSAPLLEYFKPLHDWLVEQNEGVPVGWDESK